MLNVDFVSVTISMFDFGDLAVIFSKTTIGYVFVQLTFILF